MMDLHQEHKALAGFVHDFATVCEAEFADLKDMFVSLARNMGQLPKARTSRRTETTSKASAVVSLGATAEAYATNRGHAFTEG